jgi:hypothetical protein
MLDLTLLDQILHRTRHMLDRHVGINPVLVQLATDDVDLEPLQRRPSDLGMFSGRLSKPICLLVSGIEPPAELGGDHCLVAMERERLAPTSSSFANEP